MSKKRVMVKKMHEDAVIPKYAKAGDAGFDLVAVEDVIIAPGETKIIPTGLAFGIPEGYEIQIRPRSGVSAKTKLRVANSPGTIDAGFRGEVGVIVDNVAHPQYEINGIFLTNTPSSFVELLSGGGEQINGYNEAGSILIRKGDRIAQGVLAEVPMAIFEEVMELGDTERGEGGFGSSGV